MRRSIILLAIFVVSGCAGDSAMSPPQPPAMVVIKSVLPATILPGTAVIVSGDNIVPSAEHYVSIKGTVDGRVVDHLVSLEVVEGEARGLWRVDHQTFTSFGEGTFQGTVQVVSKNEWDEVRSQMHPVSLTFTRQLTPSLTPDVVGGGLVPVFLNMPIRLDSNNILMGGEEGETLAEVQGCFARGTGSCLAGGGQPVQAQVVVQPEDATRRLSAFPFSPAIAGIEPGRFEGTVTLINRHSDGTTTRSTTIPASYDLQPSYFTAFEQQGVSLGQYLHLNGQGFIDGTALRFEGTFTPTTTGTSRSIQFEIRPEFDRYDRASYVIEEGIGIGQAIDLRSERGALTGQWTVVTRYTSAEAIGQARQLTLNILPVKQVVWIRFTGGWVDALRKFGLQAADDQIRARIVEIFRRDYDGLNVEARLEEPEDFKLFTRVDVMGRDPNYAIQFGLDATPNKDLKNMRLHDIVGGMYAETQKQNFRPYGGVFTESILGISTHPPKGIYKAWIQSTTFDQVYDPFRPDVGARQLSSAEVAAAPVIDTVTACPAKDRAMQVSCAIRVLGNLIGTTSTHEFGHSLGLAQPGVRNVTNCHNRGDAENRIMDAGKGRGFEERAEMGKGPSVFCGSNYTYLRGILPLDVPAPAIQRPPCN